MKYPNPYHLRYTYSRNLDSAVNSLGSLTTDSLAKVDTRPTLLVASHIKRPESEFWTFDIPREHMLPI